MAVFRPSAVVRLVIRFDEGAEQGALRARMDAAAAAVDRPPELATGITTAEELEDQLEVLGQRMQVVEDARLDGFFTLDAIEEELAELRAQRTALQSQIDELAGVTAALQADLTDDGDTVIGGILPRTVEIDRNGIREADKCSIEFDHRDAPFDPRIIRAVGVEVTLGVVSAEDWADGMQGVIGPEGLPLSIVGRAPATSDDPTDGTTRFLGVVDTWTVSLGSDGGDTVKLECRDMRALFIDQPMADGVSIDTGLPIDVGIFNLFNEFPSLAGTDVIYEGPVPAPVPMESVPRVHRARRGRRATRARRSASMSVWDAVTDLCVQTGLIPIWEDNRLRIVEPRTFYERTDQAIRMVYGRNVSELQFSRKLGGVKVPTVEVRAIDPERGRVRWARYPVPTDAPREGVFGETDPPRPARPNQVPPNGLTPEDRVATYVLQGLSAPGALAAAAEAIWQQLGRQELEGNIETDEVSSWEQPVDGVDLLRMRPGDALELRVARDELAGGQPAGAALVSATELASLTRQARAEYLERIGWAPRVAQRFAALQDATQFQTVFRVGTVRLRWEAENGVSVACDWANFLETRELGDAAATGSRTELQGFVITGSAAGDGTVEDATEGLEAVRSEREGLTDAREAGTVDPMEYEDRMEQLDGSEVALQQEVDET